MGSLLCALVMDHELAITLWAVGLTALVGAFSWIFVTAYNSSESRHKRAENKFEDLDENTADIRYRTDLSPWRSHKSEDDSSS